MEMLGKIKRMHLRDKLSLHEITKRTGLSRNTVRKWLRSPKEVPVAVPVYRRRDATGKLGAFHAALEQALKVDSHRLKQNRRTAKDLFEHIKLAGSIAATRLGEHPNLGKQGKISGTRELIPHENYRLVYEIENKTVWILALVHTARQWPRLRE